MGFQLVAIAGDTRGQVWPITHEGLSLGRDPENDVVLSDPTVSRRHCRLLPREDEVQVEDLGSLNPLTINGQQAKEGVLRVGDELVAGETHFLISEDPGQSLLPDTHMSKGRHGAPPPAKKERPPNVRAVVPLDSIGERAPTTRDGAYLYETIRELCGSSRIDGLTAALERQLGTRFTPVRTWIALVNDGNHRHLDFLVQDDDPLSSPAKLIERTLQTREGLLIVERGNTKRTLYTIIAPAFHNGLPVAAIALRTDSLHGSYDESDLRLLVLLAQAFAPFVRSAASIERLKAQNEQLRALTGEQAFLMGTSPTIHRVREQVMQAATAGMNVLLLGETGTGRESVARRIHNESTRGRQPWMVAHCAIIPPEQFEKTMLGTTAGTLRDASSKGLLAQAHQGTLYLDKVDRLSPENQARLVHMIARGVMLRANTELETRIDVRFIASAAIAVAEDFRDDLYRHLSAFEIRIPPLRERPEDIELLARYFLEQHRDQAMQPLEGFAPGVLSQIATLPWPGNVHALRDSILQAIRLTKHSLIRYEDIVPVMPSTA